MKNIENNADVLSRTIREAERNGKKLKAKKGKKGKAKKKRTEKKKSKNRRPQRVKGKGNLGKEKKQRKQTKGKKKAKGKRKRKSRVNGIPKKTGKNKGNKEGSKGKKGKKMRGKRRKSESGNKPRQMRGQLRNSTSTTCNTISCLNDLLLVLKINKDTVQNFISQKKRLDARLTLLENKNNKSSKLNSSLEHLATSLGGSTAVRNNQPVCAGQFNTTNGTGVR